MKRYLFVILLALYSAFVFGEGASPMEVLVVRLVLSDDTLKSKLGTKMVYGASIKNIKILDAIAWQLHHNGNRHTDIDLLSWYAKTLQLSDSQRYRGVLVNTANELKNRKLTAYVKKTVRILEKLPEGEPFDPTQYAKSDLLVDLATTETQKVASEEVFDSIVSGQTLDSVLSEMGLPVDVQQELHTKRQPMVGSITTQQLVLVYQGLGNILITHERGSFRVARVHKAIELSDTNLSPKYAETILELMDGTPQQNRITAQHIYKNRMLDEDVLDAVGERLWQDRNLTENLAEDGLAWLVKCIHLSGNPRYKTLLQNISTSAASKKVRDYARKLLPGLLNIEMVQFIPSDDAESFKTGLTE